MITSSNASLLPQLLRREVYQGYPEQECWVDAMQPYEANIETGISPSKLIVQSNEKRQQNGCL